MASFPRSQAPYSGNALGTPSDAESLEVRQRLLEALRSSQEAKATRHLLEQQERWQSLGTTSYPFAGRGRVPKAQAQNIGESKKLLLLWRSGEIAQEAAVESAGGQGCRQPSLSLAEFQEEAFLLCLAGQKRSNREEGSLRGHREERIGTVWMQRLDSNVF